MRSSADYQRWQDRELTSRPGMQEACLYITSASSTASCPSMFAEASPVPIRTSLGPPIRSNPQCKVPTERSSSSSSCRPTSRLVVGSKGRCRPDDKAIGLQLSTFVANPEMVPGWLRRLRSDRMTGLCTQDQRIKNVGDIAVVDYPRARSQFEEWLPPK